MKRIRFISIVTALIIMAATVFTACQDYSTGERVGVITKVSQKGKIWKSTEIEMKIAPGIVSGSQMVGQYETFSVSVDNDNTIVCETCTEDILKYAKEGTPVCVSYQQVYALNWAENRGHTDYFITKIEPLNSESK